MKGEKIKRGMPQNAGMALNAINANGIVHPMQKCICLHDFEVLPKKKLITKRITTKRNWTWQRTYLICDVQSILSTHSWPKRMRTNANSTFVSSTEVESHSFQIESYRLLLISIQFVSIQCDFTHQTQNAIELGAIKLYSDNGAAAAAITLISKRFCDRRYLIVSMVYARRKRYPISRSIFDWEFQKTQNGVLRAIEWLNAFEWALESLRNSNKSTSRPDRHHATCTNIASHVIT